MFIRVVEKQHLCKYIWGDKWSQLKLSQTVSQTTEIDQQAAIIKTGDDPYICDIREQYKKHQHNNETSGPFGEDSSISQGILGIGDIVVTISVWFVLNMYVNVYHCNCMISFTIVSTYFCRFYHVEMKNSNTIWSCKNEKNVCFKSLYHFFRHWLYGTRVRKDDENKSGKKFILIIASFFVSRKQVINES